MSLNLIPESRRVTLTGPAGRLDAVIEHPEAESSGSGLVGHPHPLHGGTMHNKVVYQAAKGMVEAGLSALRFNFRGVGDSEGEHDHGRGEVDDATAALELLEELQPGKPLIAAGFSFGAGVCLKAALARPAVTALIGIGVPLTHASFEFIHQVQKPVLLVHGANDEFGPADQVRDLASAMGANGKLVMIPDTGHFFAGKIGELRDAIEAFCRQQLITGRELG